MRKELNKKLELILSTYGFIKVRDFFIRKIDDIIQTAMFIYTPVRMEDCKGYYLSFGMASLYDHNIFGIIKDTHGYLTGQYTVDVNDFTAHLRGVKRGVPIGYSEDVQLEEFKEYCLPFLNSVRNLDDFYEARMVMQTVFGRDVAYNLSPDKNLCLKIGKYDEAIKRINASYEYYDEVVKCRSWYYYDDIFDDIVKVKRLLQEGDKALIEEYLMQEKQKNLEIYQSIIPKSKRKLLAEDLN